MRVPRQFVRPEQVKEGRIVLDPSVCHKLLRVLRLRCGDRFVVFDGSGMEYHAVLRGSNKDKTWWGEVLHAESPRVESSLSVDLYLAMCRTTRFESALERATEMGVARIIPLVSERARSGEPGYQRIERWQKIILSACEQSGRVVIPVLDAPVRLAEALQTTKTPVKFMFVPGYPPPDACPGREVSVFVGPEGGFSGNEIELARLNSVSLVGMGPRILRVETAVTSALALLNYLAGEMDVVNRQSTSGCGLEEAGGRFG